MYDSSELKPGYYWVRFSYPDRSWEPAEWAREWVRLGIKEGHWTGDVIEVGARLEHETKPISDRFHAAFYARGDHKYSGIEIYEWLRKVERE